MKKEKLITKDELEKTLKEIQVLKGKSNSLLDQEWITKVIQLDQKLMIILNYIDFLIKEVIIEKREVSKENMEIFSSLMKFINTTLIPLYNSKEKSDQNISIQKSNLTSEGILSNLVKMILIFNKWDIFSKIFKIQKNRKTPARNTSTETQQDSENEESILKDLISRCMTQTLSVVDNHLNALYQQKLIQIKEDQGQTQSTKLDNLQRALSLLASSVLFETQSDKNLLDQRGLMSLLLRLNEITQLVEREEPISFLEASVRDRIIPAIQESQSIVVVESLFSKFQLFIKFLKYHKLLEQTKQQQQIAQFQKQALETYGISLLEILRAKKDIFQIRSPQEEIAQIELATATSEIKSQILTLNSNQSTQENKTQETQFVNSMKENEPIHFVSHQYLQSQISLFESLSLQTFQITQLQQDNQFNQRFMKILLYEWQKLLKREVWIIKSEVMQSIQIQHRISQINRNQSFRVERSTIIELVQNYELILKNLLPNIIEAWIQESYTV